MKTQDIMSTILAIVVVVAGLILGLNVNQQKQLLQNTATVIEMNSGLIQELSELKAVETPEVLTGEVETGVVLEQDAQTWSIWVSIVQECTPGPQPTEHAGNYSGNTEILNTRASQNNCVFDVTGLSQDAELVVYLAQETTTDNQVHVWFKGENAYGRLVSTKGDSTLVYDLSNVLISWEGKSEYNMLWSLNEGKEITLQTYVSIFDGNYVDAVVIMD